MARLTRTTGFGTKPREKRRAASDCGGAAIDVWRTRGFFLHFSTKCLPLMQLKTYQYRLWGRFAPLGRALRARGGWDCDFL